MSEQLKVNLVDCDVHLSSCKPDSQVTRSDWRMREGQYFGEQELWDLNGSDCLILLALQALKTA